MLIGSASDPPAGMLPNRVPGIRSEACPSIAMPQDYPEDDHPVVQEEQFRVGIVEPVSPLLKVKHEERVDESAPRLEGLADGILSSGVKPNGARPPAQCLRWPEVARRNIESSNRPI